MCSMHQDYILLRRSATQQSSIRMMPHITGNIARGAYNPLRDHAPPTTYMKSAHLPFFSSINGTAPPSSGSAPNGKRQTEGNQEWEGKESSVQAEETV